MNDKLKYHGQMQGIVDRDVAFLVRKDTQYNASWKENGRSAWFMLRRMMDRLINMMSRPVVPVNFRAQNVRDAVEVLARTDQRDPIRFAGTNAAMAEHFEYLLRVLETEDILETVTRELHELDQPGDEAPDGRVISVLRDLRRYAILVEAEATQRIEDMRYPSSESQTITAEAIETLHDGESVVRAVPLEDSNRHAERMVPRPRGHTELVPWVVNERWLKDLSMSESDINKWWISHTSRAKKQWILRDCVVSTSPPPILIANLFKVVTNTSHMGMYIVDIKQCPPEIRSRYPKFSEEVNQFELNLLAEWSRALYHKDKSDDEKYRLTDAAWSRW